MAGLAHALRAENSVRIQVGVFVVVIAVMSWLRPEPVWWGLVLLASSGVLTAELLNTAVEHLADHLHPEMHPSIRTVKDCAAAAVLVAVLGAITVGIALAAHLLLRK
ncbi:MAG TPA: diacylglycerol kinase [Steroidobacteraceae bacterium]